MVYNNNPPTKIQIIGEDKTLSSLIEKFPGLWEVADENVVNYRKCWKLYVPKRDPDNPTTIINQHWCVAYLPIVAIRKCYSAEPGSSNSGVVPYFFILLNAGRDERPSTHKVDTKESDPLQKNLIERDMILSDFEDFYLCPNGYPYHRYASLLISRDKERMQELPTAREIASWMKFSILTRQYVFFNSPHAGATILTRLHAQVVDPAGIRYEDEEVRYPLLNRQITKRTNIRGGIDRLDGYGIEALVLRGRDAPYRAELVVNKMRNRGDWYNIMINSREIFVVARNAEKETSECIGKRVGSYELSGVVLVGNIEEPLLDQLDTSRVVSGSEIFSQLGYEQVCSNVADATTALGGLENQL